MVVYDVLKFVEICSQAMVDATPQQEAEAYRLAEGVRQYLGQETKDQGCGSLAIFLCLLQLSQLLKQRHLEANCLQND